MIITITEVEWDDDFEGAKPEAPFSIRIGEQETWPAEYDFFECMDPNGSADDIEGAAKLIRDELGAQGFGEADDVDWRIEQ